MSILEDIFGKEEEPEIDMFDFDRLMKGIVRDKKQGKYNRPTDPRPLRIISREGRQRLKRK